MKYTIHQGDSVSIPLTLKRNGTTQTSSNISKLEVIIAGIRKVYPGGISWDATNSRFMVPLAQSETLALTPGIYSLQVRPLFSADNSVLGWIGVGDVEVVAMKGAQTL